jgi:hypothetical protein
MAELGPACACSVARAACTIGTASAGQGVIVAVGAGGLVGVRVAVGVAVGRGVAVGVRVGVAVGVALGVGVGGPHWPAQPASRNHAKRRARAGNERSGCTRCLGAVLNLPARPRPEKWLQRPYPCRAASYARAR